MNLNLYKKPLREKRYRARLSPSSRYLAKSVKESRLALKTLEAIGKLEEELDDLDSDDSDFSEDEQDILDEISDIFPIFIELACEKRSQGVPQRANTHLRIAHLDDRNIALYYRFRSKDDLQRVFACLQIPALCGPIRRNDGTSAGYIQGEELFLFYLRRLCEAKYSLEKMCTLEFGGDTTKWCRGFNWLARWLYRRWGYKLENNLLYYQPFFMEYSECIRQYIEEVSSTYPLNLLNPLPALHYVANTYRIAFFIDCNCTASSRPGSGPVRPGLVGAPRLPNADALQRGVYNRWAKKHGIKDETLDAPNGLTINRFGSASIRHSDLWNLGQGNINGRLAAIQQGLPPNQQKGGHGDAIYPQMSHIGSKHVGNLTPIQQSENKANNSAREAIENNYGQGHELFPYLNYKQNLKLRNGSPISEIYFTKLLFRNMHVCLYENVTSSRFKCPTPTLEHYMQ